MRLCAGITYIETYTLASHASTLLHFRWGCELSPPRAIPKRNLPLDDVLIWLLSQPYIQTFPISVRCEMLKSSLGRLTLLVLSFSLVSSPFNSPNPWILPSSCTSCVCVTWRKYRAYAQTTTCARFVCQNSDLSSAPSVYYNERRMKGHVWGRVPFWARRWTKVGTSLVVNNTNGWCFE